MWGRAVWKTSTDDLTPLHSKSCPFPCRSLRGQGHWHGHHRRQAVTGRYRRQPQAGQRAVPVCVRCALEGREWQEGYSRLQSRRLVSTALKHRPHPPALAATACTAQLHQPQDRTLAHLGLAHGDTRLLQSYQGGALVVLQGRQLQTVGNLCV